MLGLSSKTKATAVIILLLAAVVGINNILNQGITTTAKFSRFSARMALNTGPTTIKAPIAANDSNWAGYIIASDLQNPQPSITNVSASWIVPTVSVSTQADTFSAIWIGIGGFFDNLLIQVGTEQDSVADQGVYSAWYELLPDLPVTIGTVSPGDRISACIQLVSANTNTWSIYIQDVTSNEVFQNDFNYAADQLSAEWIVERPLAGRSLATLADVGRVTFTNCLATVGTQRGSISAFPEIESIMYNTVQNTTGITQLTAVSDLSTDGSSFTVETSPSLIPELSVWIVIPLTVGAAISSVFSRKRIRKEDE